MHAYIHTHIFTMQCRYETANYFCQVCYPVDCRELVPPGNTTQTKSLFLKTNQNISIGCRPGFVSALSYNSTNQDSFTISCRQDGSLRLGNVRYIQQGCRCPVNTVFMKQEVVNIGGNLEIQDFCACAPNFYGLGGLSCTACPPNTYSRNNSKTVASCLCVAGYYGTGGQDCQKCPGTQTSPPDSKTIAACACQANTYFVSSSSQCLACPSFSANPPGSIGISSCVCINGYHGRGDARAKCSVCPVSSIWVILPDNYRTCICKRNFYGSGTTCNACPTNAVTLKENSTVSTDCLCNNGYYGNPGSTCTACPKGTTTPAPGALRISECVCTLALGFYGQPGVSFPRPHTRLCSHA
jgi:hypothetical protein